MHRVEGEDISFSYKNRVILSNANIRVDRGQVIGLLGSNGSGKTTFFDLLCGVKKIDSGSLKVQRERLLYLSQMISAPPALRMKDIFKMITLLATSRRSHMEAIIATLSQWSPELANRYKTLWDKRSSLCSYGEARWFFTTSLLAISTDLVVLDEPTAGVDTECRFYTWQCVKAAVSSGVSVLVSSHDVKEITEHSDAFYMLANHQFTRFADAEEYTARYQTDSVDKAFILAARTL